MENLSQSLSVMLAQSLSSIHQALVDKQKSVILGGEDVTLKQSTAIFAYSSPPCCISTAHVEFKTIPLNAKRFFKTVSFSPPDLQNILEIALVKTGMFLTRDLVSRIVSFLSVIQQTVPAFAGEGVRFGERWYLVLAKCMHQNFKEILKWKDNQLLAKELGTVTDVEDLEEEREGGEGAIATNTTNNELMFDQAIQDLNRLEEEGGCDLGKGKWKSSFFYLTVVSYVKDPTQISSRVKRVA